MAEAGSVRKAGNHYENSTDSLFDRICDCCIFSIDLGINFAYSMVPELNDGIGNWCIINIFADSNWSHAAYLSAFRTSLWISFALLVENIVVCFFVKQKS